MVYLQMVYLQMVYLQRKRFYLFTYKKLGHYLISYKITLSYLQCLLFAQISPPLEGAGQAATDY